MTNKLQQITTLALATILIAGSFSLTPFAYSTGWNDDDDDDHSDNHLKCSTNGNLIDNGCFEAPVLTNSNTNNKKWNIFNKTTTSNNLEWDVYWLADEHPCLPGEYGFGSKGLLELQRGILGGPSEGSQHAELDSDCNGPFNNARNGEQSSVGINQTFTTSENSDYKITFAYKARPDQDLGTNGIRVIWNDADITNELKPDIGFSKKDWKYASVTKPGITGTSKLAFEDTGNPDSLGTFLDDVSVFPIQKPMSSITLIKAYTNDNGGTAGSDDFDMKIKKVSGGSEIPIQHAVTATIPAGTYTISELDSDIYSFVLITGDEACPEMLENPDNNLDEFTLKKGEHITCIIYNDDNADGQSPTEDPPTITIVNQVGSDPQPFEIIVEPTVGVPEVTTEGTKYTVDSHTKVTISGSDDDDRSILITGDGNCPENIGGFVNIEKGQNITCIYDDRQVGQAGPSPTVTLKVKVIDLDLGVSEITPPSFEVDGSGPAPLDSQIQVEANKAIEITQTNDNVPDDLDENNEVLPSKIAGDGHCPEVLAGTITLSSGQDIECVFEYGAEIEPGVIFHYDTQMVGKAGLQDLDVGIPCGNLVELTYVNTATEGPCIALNGGDIWVVPDSSVTLTDTTIVLFTVIIIGSDEVTQDEPDKTTCVFNGLAPTFDQSGIPAEDRPLAFKLTCADLVDAGNWNVNYALIETDPLA